MFPNSFFLSPYLQGTHVLLTQQKVVHGSVFKVPTCYWLNKKVVHPFIHHTHTQNIRD